MVAATTRPYPMQKKKTKFVPAILVCTVLVSDLFNVMLMVVVSMYIYAGTKMDGYCRYQNGWLQYLCLYQNGWLQYLCRSQNGWLQYIPVPKHMVRVSMPVPKHMVRERDTRKNKTIFLPTMYY